MCRELDAPDSLLHTVWELMVGCRKETGEREFRNLYVITSVLDEIRGMGIGTEYAIDAAEAV